MVVDEWEVVSQRRVVPVTSGDSRLSIQGGHYSKITFKVRPLHITLHFLHLCILKIGLKLHVCALKILGLAMPMHISTFHHDFPKLTFHQGAMVPLKIAYACHSINGLGISGPGGPFIFNISGLPGLLMQSINGPIKT